MVAARSVNRCHRLSTTTAIFKLVKRLHSQIICFVPWRAWLGRSRRRLQIFLLDTGRKMPRSDSMIRRYIHGNVSGVESTSLETIVNQGAVASAKPLHASRWILPTWKDPRIPFAALLTLYAILGCTVLGFNRSPGQILLTIAVGCSLDMFLHWLFFRREWIVPLSAYISSISIALLLNYSHNHYLLFLPVFFCIASKYLFTFYMMTDPKTSPSGTRAQVLRALVIVIVDLWLHTRQSLNTIFLALFLVSAARLLWLHGREFFRSGLAHCRLSLSGWFLTRLAAVLILGTAGYVTYARVIHPRFHAHPGFQFVAVPSSVSGIDSRMSNVMEQVDLRLRHIAKWVLSVGDAIAVGDYDNDGRPDIFLTNPLKRPEDRNALYRNLGGFRFERVEIPALKEISAHPEKYGLVGGALFVDYDNSGAQSLFLMMAYGKSRLLKNMLPVKI